MTISIKEAAELIRAGELVAFPTETVYGLGANALDAAAVAKIYELKGRPPTSPLIVHVASIEMARDTRHGVAAAKPRNWRAQYWPGPLTLVLPKNASDSRYRHRRACRPSASACPTHPLALALIEAAGVPLAAPSANRFTGLSPTTAEHVRAAFGDAVPVLDGGPRAVGIESTVVSIAGRKAHAAAARHDFAGRNRADGSASARGAPHPAPGMHDRHYSPRTPLVWSNDAAELPDRTGAYVWRAALGPDSARRSHALDAEAYAAQLYSVLHDLDREAGRGSRSSRRRIDRSGQRFATACRSRRTVEYVQCSSP